ncbi:bile acid:sodium symporter family protein [Kistimonas scapharcae]|uniref:Bile acid:sodium symporter family protein n=1 Tax=Kistimonas scapharcae TaxID=1036133 RepID=A0ABP8UYE0_9GAMM
MFSRYYSACFMIVALSACIWPQPWLIIQPFFFWLLAIIMVLMGLTLSWSDFLNILKQPGSVCLGVVLQFLVMPLLAWLISLALGYPTEWLIGMLLVGVAPGGIASNALTYLAGGNVALSISMTLVSTLLSLFMTPLLTGCYLSTVIHVDKTGMLLSIAQIVILPVVVGLLAVHMLGEPRIRKVRCWLPGLSLGLIMIAVSTLVALNADNLNRLSWTLLLGVLIHNAFGLLSGYLLARCLGQPTANARAIGIEVGTQNTGLAMALALKHFTPLATLPGAIFSVSQNIFGVTLARYWRRNDQQSDEPL